MDNLPSKYALLTISDGVASGHRTDDSAAAIRALLPAQYQLVASAVVPDDADAIQRQVTDFIVKTDARLILTTGGTGLSPRDNTPQATADIADYDVPGFGELMRAKTTAKSPRAALSRAAAFVKSGVLIINLPGSPRGATEMLDAVAELLPHALAIISGDTAHSADETSAE